MQNITFNESPEANRIPIHGSMTRPADPAEGLAEMIAGRIEWKGGKLSVRVETNEFTSVCPSTGQPDFNNIEIRYVPNEYYLESKTLKFYFWSFRDFGAHCETLADLICKDVVEAIDPFSCSVIVYQNPRGGVKIVSRADYEK